MNLDEITFQEMPKTPSEMPTKEEVEQFDKEMELYDKQSIELENKLAPLGSMYKTARIRRKLSSAAIRLRCGLKTKA